MNKYEGLLDEAYSKSIKVVEKATFESSSYGLIVGNKIGLNKDINTEAIRTCVLAEELGHYYTNAGNIINLNKEENLKQELKAREWAYENLVGIKGLIDAFEKRYTHLCEIAEYLDVTEHFLNEAINFYKKKYGIGIKHDKYFIGFEPFLYIIKELEVYE